MIESPNQSQMMRQDKTSLVKFVKKVSSFSGEIFQPSLLVWSNLSYFQDDFCKKHIGKRSVGNPHAAFDEVGTGNVEWLRYCDTRRRKGE